MTTDVNLKYITFLSVVAALGGFLFGYDTAVISGTIAQVTSQFGLSAVSQGWYVGCALVGCIIGVLFGGQLVDRYGRKATLLISAVLFAVSSLMCAVVGDFSTLVLSRIMGGIGIGVVSIVSPMYIAELSVPQYRGRLVSLYQLAITVGFLGAYLVNYGLLQYSLGEAQHLEHGWLKYVFHQEVWRGMLGIEVIPSLLFFFVLFFIPESPRWLVLKGQDSKAQNVLQRIYSSGSRALQEMEVIRSTASAGGSSLNWSLLRQPGVRKAVFIGAAIAILGQFMGVNAVLYYGPTIFEANGISSGDSLFYQTLIGLVNMGTTILALFFIDKIGRKKLVYIGVSGMILCLLLIGGYFLIGGMSGIFLLACFLTYIFFCAGSISAVIFVFLSEMYPNAVRGTAMSMAGFSLWVGTYLVGQLTPWLLENLTPGGTFLFFAVMCLPYMFIVWRLMPETSGKSLEEIEKYWLEK